MTDELSIPQVPDAKPDDPEDVSWALSTAEAMWARGDHSEGIKWVRRAAEAASEAENDGRALELAKAAADLQGVIARMSLADRGPSASERSVGASGTPPPAPSKPKGPPPAPSKPKAPTVSSAPPAGGRSVPPIGRTSQKPPPPRSSAAPPAPAPSSAPAPSAPPKPSSGRSIPPIGGVAASGRPSSPPPAKGKRKNTLESDARIAGLLDTAPHPIVSAETAEVAAITGERRPPESDPTMVAAREDIEKRRASSRSAAEWDAIAANHLVPDDVDPGDRKTTLGVPLDPAPTGRSAPQSIPPRGGSSRPSVVPHDQSIQTCQAVKVVVWRDANGVHVAPAGTVVSAIKIEAVLVALEPTADLTAWLSAKTR